MELVPLFGAEFNVYSPIIILIVGMLTFLNVYSRILKMVGIENEDAITGSCTTCHKLDADDIELIAIGKKHVTSQMHLISGRGANTPARMSKVMNEELPVAMNPHVLATSNRAVEDVENPLYACCSARVESTGAKQQAGSLVSEVFCSNCFNKTA